MELLNPSVIPLSLYIHFPWCIRKCPYCDFNSHELKGEIDERRYLDTLKADLLDDLSNHALKNPNPGKNRNLDSIFLGGGTPSLFSASAMAELITFVKVNIEAAPDLEVTLEANPGALEHSKFESYLDAGINRLSLGVQSFNDASLKQLGRIHNADNAREAIGQAQSAGFTNMNLDIMYGLPNQTIEQLKNETDEAINFDSSHLSFYQLTLEPNTLFHKHPPTLPDDDSVMEMQEFLTSRLMQSGFERYEVSAYSQPGRQCRHNLNYWNFGDYLGIGAGAHSKLTTESGIVRNWKAKLPRAYMSRLDNDNLRSNITHVDRQSRLFEFMLNALRLRKGFHLDSFESRTGLDRNVAIAALEKSTDQGLISMNGETVSCTDRGYLFIDEILQQLLP
jgi:putative oxygen-independent coproporphyrinogen III oxidase